MSVCNGNVFVCGCAEKVYKLILEHQSGNKIPLCINPNSAAFKMFSRSVLCSVQFVNCRLLSCMTIDVNVLLCCIG